MSSGFYLRTAWNNIRKNYRFYIPQILTGTGLLACLYIVYTLTVDERLADIPGGNYLPTFMLIGTAVIALLSAILILYTNSFLMRQRKREYGLYNVLGLEKRHIGKILFFETLISAGLSIVMGSALGLLFYKACSLFICCLFQADIILGFDFISLGTLLPPAAYFAFLYLMTCLFNRIRIARLKPVELLASRQTGEKEPRVKWLLFILGILSLSGGYLISIVTKEPLSAILLFFVAVFLVIIGSYCLFTAGTIFVLKRLKSKRGYYYDRRHMPAVSGLLYRMKQNAVGLASICILATGVLVMISTTVSLYSGMQETLDGSYPQDMYLSCEFERKDGRAEKVSAGDLQKIVENEAKKAGLPIRSLEKQEYLEVAYLFDGETFRTEKEEGYLLPSIVDAVFITEETYTDLSGRVLDLGPGELAIGLSTSTPGETLQPKETLFLHGKSYTVKEKLIHFPIETTMANIKASCYGIVLQDEAAVNEIYLAQKEAYGRDASEMTERVAAVFEDREEAAKKGKELVEGIDAVLMQLGKENAERTGVVRISCHTYWDAKEAVVGMYGTLLFLGIILGLVCLFATVLIIYYKQISEGYEDRERYQIMKKVGMSSGEIMATIRSQSRLVFFLPLVAAGVHTAFAFPMLNRLLHLLLLSSTKLFVICTLVTYGVFALVYLLIYSVTARTYYKIVH